MKILFLPNWHVNFLIEDQKEIQAPDKYIKGQPYWFFKHMNNVEVDIIDNQKHNIFHSIEKKIIKNYFYQCYIAFRKRKNYDVVISHGAQSGLFYSLLITLFGGKQNPTHFIIDIGGMNGARINKIETPAIQFALRCNPYIIYHASSQIELYKTAYPEIVLKSKFIHFGVDCEYFIPQNLPTENYILSFGYYKRDYDTLLNAWKKIKTDCKLKIVGVSGINTENIEFIPKLGISDLMEHIAKSLFVVIPLPVYNYSYGQMSFLQSMAMGKPVVVTKTPSSYDYLKNGQGSFFVKPYDIEDMKEKIESLLFKKENLPELGILARKQAENRLNEKTMAESIYRFIVKN